MVDEFTKNFCLYDWGFCLYDFDSNLGLDKVFERQLFFGDESKLVS
jgi:hypothetical protein